jgi:hypothetical protein
MRRFKSATSCDAASSRQSSGVMPRDLAAAFFGARLAGARLRPVVVFGFAAVAIVGISVRSRCLLPDVGAAASLRPLQPRGPAWKEATILRRGPSSFNPGNALFCERREGMEMQLKLGLGVRLACLALVAATTAGCIGVQVPKAWEPLLEEVRAFEQRIGFRKTATFVEFSEEQGRVPFCGHVSRLYLPYSYEDPAILWYDVATERECRAHADGADVYFGTVEVLGESNAAVSPEVLAVQLNRFLYLVIHEDCHEQFGFPYGIEEALCNLIAYKGMAAFSEEKYGAEAREHVAIQRYANRESERTRAIRTLYEQLAGHYARYERKELSEDALLRERAQVFGACTTRLAATSRAPSTSSGAWTQSSRRRTNS